jgi:hypothetical protein
MFVEPHLALSHRLLKCVEVFSIVCYFQLLVAFQNLDSLSSCVEFDILNASCLSVTQRFWG